MTKNYAKGRAKEYRAMKGLSSEGWLVSRSAMSHGPVDIFAAKDGRRLVIQVESGKTNLNFFTGLVIVAILVKLAFTFIEAGDPDAFGDEIPSVIISIMILISRFVAPFVLKFTGKCANAILKNSLHCK